MKTIFSILFTSIFAFGFSQISSTAVDLTKSSVEWIGKKVTGQHTGTISLKKATLEFKEEKLVGGVFVLDMESISCTDLGAAMAKKLVDHLESEDFFYVSKYKEAILKFTKVTNIEGNSFQIVADLTIKGATHPIIFATKVKTNEAIATLKIDRTLYDVRYGSASFFENIGDKAIDDIFEIKVVLAY